MTVTYCYYSYHMNNNNNTCIPIEMIDLIGSFLPFRDFLNLCTAHRGMNALFHHPIGHKVYVDRYTKEIKYKYPNCTVWRYRGERHRENDQPAVVYADGSQLWFYHGELHRENDQPAIVYTSGSKQWYYHGKLHRENDQPAVVYADGSKLWYYHGELHRENDQPAVVNANGSQEWWCNGKRQVN